jgi:hypothetical protein
MDKGLHVIVAQNRAFLSRLAHAWIGWGSSTNERLSMTEGGDYGAFALILQIVGWTRPGRSADKHRGW